jgi:hypothetical protein
VDEKKTCRAEARSSKEVHQLVAIEDMRAAKKEWTIQDSNPGFLNTTATAYAFEPGPQTNNTGRAALLQGSEGRY